MRKEDKQLQVKLKPGTPAEIRREIRKKERARDRMEHWFIRLSTVLLLLLIGILAVCELHYGLTY